MYRCENNKLIKQLCKTSIVEQPVPTINVFEISEINFRELLKHKSNPLRVNKHMTCKQRKLIRSLISPDMIRIISTSRL